MRFFGLVATSALLLSSVFAAPIPQVASRSTKSLYLNLPLSKRLLLFKRGLFSEAIQFSDLGDAQALGAAVGNVVGGPPKVCEIAANLFNRLAAGEAAGGENTIGDRAVAGMRRMLGGVSVQDTMSLILSGDLNDNQLHALRELVANPDKTIASLEAYKHLLDTQASLQTTIDLVQNVGGERKIQDEVLDVLLPIMQGIETRIDKIGDDFSAQSFDPTDEDVLLDLISDSSTRIASLQSLNTSLISTITESIANVQESFNLLEGSARVAVAIPVNARLIEIAEMEAGGNPGCVA